MTEKPSINNSYVVSILGLTIHEIARLKACFEAKDGKNFTEFWEEAFNAGVETARRVGRGQSIETASMEPVIASAALEISDIELECNGCLHKEPLGQKLILQSEEQQKVEIHMDDVKVHFWVRSVKL